MQIPPFTADGLLPPGDYPATFPELRASHLVLGAVGMGKSWDGAWRKLLVDNAEMLVGELWKIGVTEIFLDGTFVEAKDHPNDIDGYFEVDFNEYVSGAVERNLNLLNPHKIWTWDPRSRTPDINSLKKQLPMWHQYRVELYPHYLGNLCGIQDQYGNELQFRPLFGNSVPRTNRKGL